MPMSDLRPASPGAVKLWRGGLSVAGGVVPAVVAGIVTSPLIVFAVFAGTTALIAASFQTASSPALRRSLRRRQRRTSSRRARSSGPRSRDTWNDIGGYTAVVVLCLLVAFAIPRIG